MTPSRPPDSYRRTEEIDPNNFDYWVFIGEPSKCYPSFHIRKWKEIVKDLTLGNPQYYDMRKPEKGIQERKSDIYK
jgi:hypothetical protein